uniref:Uncharacterized protein n=1 Tax=Romanomermis culicivorax TaxID=13658 RepID=A0A915JNS0_ROMCU
MEMMITLLSSVVHWANWVKIRLFVANATARGACPQLHISVKQLQFTSMGVTERNKISNCR